MIVESEGTIVPRQRTETGKVISLKGEQIEWREGLTVRAALEETGLYGRLVYVAVNGKRVRMRDWENYRIPDGAKLEVFPMVLGG